MRNYTLILIPFVKSVISGHIKAKTSASVVTLVNAKYSTKSEVTINTKPYKLYRLEKGPNSKASLTKNDALDMYEKMLTIRRMENAGNIMYKSSLIRGFLHLYSGQEAVAVGISKEMGEKDTVTGAYRIHGWAYIMGITATAILAELTYRKTGCTRAKGGSMHMYTKSFFGGNGIVGAQIPIGTGSAMAHKMKNDGAISWTLYGDGSANQGQGFEAMNMAKLWGLPCIYVCENNHYGMGTREDRASANTDFYTRGDLIPGIKVDGMDLVTSREAARFAVEFVKNCNTPIILEMETYRYFGHSMSDPGTSYRSREEVQKVRQARDPIVSFREQIIKLQLATPDEIKAIDLKVKKIIDDAVAHAKEDPFVDLSEIAADVYQKCLEPDQTIRGRLPNTPIKHINIAPQKTT